MRIVPTTRPRVAFTLVEVMLSIAIMALIVTAIYSCWTAILRASKSGLTAARQAQQERTSVKTIQDAFSSAVMFSENVSFYSFNTDTRSDLQLVSFVAHLPDTFPGSGLFPGQPTRRVTFAVESTKDGRNALIMRQESLFDVLEPGQEAYPITLAKEVSLFTVEFWDTNSKSGEWVADWDLTNQLPQLVRVTMAVGGEKSKAAASVSTSVIQLPSITVTRDMQAPMTAQAGGGRPPILKPGQPAPGGTPIPTK